MDASVPTAVTSAELWSRLMELSAACSISRGGMRRVSATSRSCADVVVPKLEHERPSPVVISSYGDSAELQEAVHPICERERGLRSITVEPAPPTSAIDIAGVNLLRPRLSFLDDIMKVRPNIRSSASQNDAAGSAEHMLHLPSEVATFSAEANVTKSKPMLECFHAIQIGNFSLHKRRPESVR